MTITIREPGSAITHFIGMVLAIFATIPMLVKASLVSTRAGIIAMAVFMTSMILLYTASTLYHSVNLRGHSLRFFQKIDHMMIFVKFLLKVSPIFVFLLLYMWQWAGPASPYSVSCSIHCLVRHCSGCSPAACSIPWVVSFMR